MGAEANGMAYASSCLTGPWALLNNVGGLTGISAVTMSASCELSPSLPWARRSALAIGLPLKLTTIGIGAYRFGDRLYSEQMVTAGFSNKLGLASLGMRFDYIQYRAESFGNKSALSICLGGIAEITPSISVGAFMTNINQAWLSREQNERLPTSMSVGVGIKPTENLFIAAEAEGGLEQSLSYRSGIAYRATKGFVARTGFSLNPDTAFIGIGFTISKLTLDYAFQYHSRVFSSHQASIAYTFANK